MFVQLLNQNATNILEKARRFMAFQVSGTHRFLLTPFCQQQQGWHGGEGQVSERNEREQRVAMGRGREAWGTKASHSNPTVGQSAWKLWAERTREVSNTILFTAGNPPASAFATWPVRLFKLPGTCALPHQGCRGAEDGKPTEWNCFPSRSAPSAVFKWQKVFFLVSCADVVWV